MLRQIVCSMAVAAGFAAPLAAPAQAAIGDGALGLRAQATQVAPVEKVQFVYRGKKYCWYRSAWNGPGYYLCGDAWNTGAGWAGGYGWNGVEGGYPPGGSGYGGGPGGFGNSTTQSSTTQISTTQSTNQTLTGGKMEYQRKPGGKSGPSTRVAGGYSGAWHGWSGVQSGRTFSGGAYPGGGWGGGGFRGGSMRFRR